MSALLLMIVLLAAACLVRAGLGALSWAACLAASVLWSLIDPQGAREAIAQAEAELSAG